MAGSVVGIDVGSSTMKAVEISGGPGGLVLERVAVSRTPDDAFVSGTIIDPSRLGQALADMLEQAGFTAKHAAVALGGTENCALRVQEYPRMTEKEFRSNLKYDAERLFPFPPADLHYDFALIEGPPEAENMEVIIAGTRREHVRNWCEALKYAKLVPETFDLEQMAQAVILVEAAPRRRERCVVLVDIGQSATNITMVQDGIPRFPRSVPIAGDRLTQAVHLEVKPDTIQEAEQLKLQYGNVSLTAGHPEDEFMDDRLLSDTVHIAVAEEHDEDLIISVDHAAPRPTDDRDSTLLLSEDRGGAAADLFGDLGDPTAADIYEPEPSEEPEPLIPAALGAVEETPPRTPEPTPQLFVDDQPVHPPGPDTQTLTLDSAADFSLDEGPGLADFDFAPSGAQAYGDEAYTTEAVGNALVAPLAELAGEIRRSIEYYRSRHQDIAVDRILVFGGSSAIRNLPSFLERELGIPTEIANPFEHIAVDESRYPRDYMASIAHLMPAAVGMCVRELV